MAVVPIVAEGREVTPTFLDRTIHLQVGHEKKEELLDIWWKLPQIALNLRLDPDLIIHDGYNITDGIALGKL